MCVCVCFSTVQTVIENCFEGGKNHRSATSEGALKNNGGGGAGLEGLEGPGGRGGVWEQGCLGCQGNYPEILCYDFI